MEGLLEFLRHTTSISRLAVQDESSLGGHLGERAPRTADDEAADVAEDDADEAVDVPEDADDGPPGTDMMLPKQHVMGAQDYSLVWQ